MDGEQLFPISVLDRVRGNELTLKHEGLRLNMFLLGFCDFQPEIMEY